MNSRAHKVDARRCADCPEPATVGAFCETCWARLQAWWALDPDERVAAPGADGLDCGIAGCEGHGSLVRQVHSLKGTGIAVHEDGFTHSWNHRSTVARRKPVDFKPTTDGRVVPTDRGKRRTQQIAEFRDALDQIGPFQPPEHPDLSGNFDGVADRDSYGPKGVDPDTVKAIVNDYRSTGRSVGEAIEQCALDVERDIDTVRNHYYRRPGPTGPQLFRDDARGP